MVGPGLQDCGCLSSGDPQTASHQATNIKQVNNLARSTWACDFYWEVSIIRRGHPALPVRLVRKQFVKDGNVQSMIVPRTGELLAGRPSKIHRRLNKSKGAYSWLTSIYRLLRSEKMTAPIKSNANSHSSPHLPGFSKRHAPPAGTHSTLPSQSPRSVGSCWSISAIGCNVKDAALNTRLHPVRGIGG